MKEQKTTVDILDFFKTGFIKNITISEKKTFVIDDLGIPDDFALGKNLEEAQVLIYGNIEFHFEKNNLYLIYCDKITGLNGGKNIHLLKKVFEKDILTLESFIDYFIIEDIYYIIEDETDDNCISVILQNSNVKFEFYPENNSQTKILSAFYLGSI